MRGLKWEPLAPWNSSKAFWTYRGLAVQPAQNVGTLDVLGALEVFTSPVDADLKLRFERNRENGWWQSSCPLHGNLRKHLGQVVTILQVGFTSKQSTFGLICSQGTPPV